MNAARPARGLHPGAWWLWAIGLAATASATTNPLVLLLLVGVAGFTVAMRRSDHPWSRSFGLYLLFGLIIVLIRVFYRFLLGGGYGDHVLLELPGIDLPGWARGIQLLGTITLESILGGLYDGMRLATIVICVGAANSLANPKRLLKTMPPALYEIATAVVVAVSVLPQLADSLRRVRAARRLRGVPGGRVGRLRGVVVPVMEDALERSMALAAGMDARGYGRAGTATKRQRWVNGLLMLLALSGICVGAYAVLDATAPRWLERPMILASLALAAVAFWLAGRRVQRTRYRPDRWRPAEIGVALSGVLMAVAVYREPLAHDATLHPGVVGFPSVSLALLVVVLVGAAAAFIAPPPLLDATTETTSEEVTHVRAA